MALKVTVLNKGDVVQADDSWRIARPEKIDDLKTLWVQQNLRCVEDLSSPQTVAEAEGDWISYPREYFAETNGLAVSDTIGLKRGPDYVPLKDLLDKEGICVRGKNFLVVEKERINTYNPPEYKYTAQELTPNHEIAKGGLTVLFQQRSEFSIGGEQIFEPKIIGRREPTFAPFKPF